MFTEGHEREKRKITPTRGRGWHARVKSGVPISKSGLPICPSNCAENGAFFSLVRGMDFLGQKDSVFGPQRLSVWTPKTESFW